MLSEQLVQEAGTHYEGSHGFFGKDMENNPALRH